MTAREVGTRLVQLCREGKSLECIETLYSEDIESVEAAEIGPFPRVIQGKRAVLEKNVKWGEAHEIHRAEAEGPYPHGDGKFAVRFAYDITNKASRERTQFAEIAVFHVQNGKIVREEFFYDVG